MKVQIPMNETPEERKARHDVLRELNNTTTPKSKIWNVAFALAAIVIMLIVVVLVTRNIYGSESDKKQITTYENCDQKIIEKVSCNEQEGMCQFTFEGENLPYFFNPINSDYYRVGQVMNICK